jgi:hypothetical protein
LETIGRYLRLISESYVLWVKRSYLSNLVRPDANGDCVSRKLISANGQKYRYA